MNTKNNILALLMFFSMAAVANSAVDSTMAPDGNNRLGGGYFDIAYITGEVGDNDIDYGAGFEWVMKGSDAGVFFRLSGDLIQFENTSGLGSRMLAADLSFPRSLVTNDAFELHAYGAVRLIISKYDIESEDSYNVEFGPRLGGGLNALLAKRFDLGAELMFTLFRGGNGASSQATDSAGYRVSTK